MTYFTVFPFIISIEINIVLVNNKTKKSKMLYLKIDIDYFPSEEVEDDSEIIDILSNLLVYSPLVVLW